MGKVNSCLKRGFIILAALIGTSGFLLIGTGLFAHGTFYFGEENSIFVGIITWYAIGSVLVLLSALGIYGACKQTKWALILFTVVMGMASSYIFLNSIAVIAHLHATLNKITEDLKSLPVPLSQASNENKAKIHQMQITFHCCGVKKGYQDWGYDIPDSCICFENSLSRCVMAPNNTRLNNETLMIFDRPCSQQMFDHDKDILTIGTVIAMAISLILMTSVALCIAIIVQLYRKQVDIPTVVYSPEAKDGNYSCLLESADGVVM